MLALFIRRRLPSIAMGIALGVAGALGVGRLIRGMLVQTSAADPLLLTSLAVMLTLVAMAAVIVPAWRATRMDPMVALRHE